jgi:hypothetical protein
VKNNNVYLNSYIFLLRPLNINLYVILSFEIKINMLCIGSAPRNLNILVSTSYSFPPFILLCKTFDQAQKEITVFKFAGCLDCST